MARRAQGDCISIFGTLEPYPESGEGLKTQIEGLKTPRSGRFAPDFVGFLGSRPRGCPAKGLPGNLLPLGWGFQPLGWGDKGMPQ